jgi:hypothetical protein
MSAATTDDFCVDQCACMKSNTTVSRNLERYSFDIGCVLVANLVDLQLLL